jgi:hypothetical protein
MEQDGAEGDYGHKAAQDLIVTRGDGFRKVGVQHLNRRNQTGFADTFFPSSGEEQEEAGQLQRR